MFLNIVLLINNKMIINKQNKEIQNFYQSLVLKTWLPWQQCIAYQYENYTIVLPK